MNHPETARNVIRNMFAVSSELDNQTLELLIGGRIPVEWARQSLVEHFRLKQHHLEVLCSWFPELLANKWRPDGRTAATEPAPNARNMELNARNGGMRQ